MRLAIVGFASVVTALPVYAQDTLGTDWYVAPTASLTINDSARAHSTGVAGGLALGKVLNDSWNVELAGQYADFGSQDGAQDNQASIVVDALYFLKRSEKFSPYITLGIGGVHEGPLPNQDRNEDLLLRGGIGFTTRLTKYVDFRVDARYQWHGSTGGAPNLGDCFISAGLNIYFR
ncbi:outer membrane beta-barrel protein [Paraburkholderia sp. J67]|uniref:outer membrane beta-barrel protein n=1 Tax=Paraburkholderia sp. J67 TaxID=2805435 RepID=UPI002ABE6DA5|nr:outer membrane beta-barrel protein [Paraburkholderia sp. J67]